LTKINFLCKSFSRCRWWHMPVRYGRDGHRRLAERSDILFFGIAFEDVLRISVLPSGGNW